MKRIFILLTVAALALTACGAAGSTSAAPDAAAPLSGGTAAANPDEALYADRDWDTGYENAQAIDCTGREDVAITAAGAYLLTGTLEGRVLVAAGAQDEVQLVLQDLTVTSTDGPALWVQSAGKVLLTLPAGSTNTLADGASYDGLDDDEPDAVVYCDADLTIQGEGALLVTGQYDHAVCSTGSLTVTGGALELSAPGKGLKARETLAVGGGSVVVTASDEAMEANNLYITGGTLNLTASDDGINAASPDDWDGAAPSLEVRGGTVLVDAEGDGLDSNGSLLVSGGVLLVAGPTANDNSALDSDSGMTVTGGIVMAVSAGSMDGGFDGASTQGSWLASVGSQTAGTSLTLVDADGAVLAHWTPGKAYGVALVSAPSMAQGGSYTLLCGAAVEGADEFGFAEGGAAQGGAEAASTTLESLNQSDAGGMMGGRGGMGGGRAPMEGEPPELPADGERPARNGAFPEGERPDDGGKGFGSRPADGEAA